MRDSHRPVPRLRAVRQWSAGRLAGPGLALLGSFAAGLAAAAAALHPELTLPPYQPATDEGAADGQAGRSAGGG